MYLQYLYLENALRSLSESGLDMIVQQNVLLNTNTGTWKIHCVLQSESGSDEIVE